MKYFCLGSSCITYRMYFIEYFIFGLLGAIDGMGQGLGGKGGYRGTRGREGNLGALGVG